MILLVFAFTFTMPENGWQMSSFDERPQIGCLDKPWQYPSLLSPPAAAGLPCSSQALEVSASSRPHQTRDLIISLEIDNECVCLALYLSSRL